MADFSVTHDFDCEPEALWRRVHFDEAHNRALFRDHLRFPVWEVESMSEREGVLRQVTRVVPSVGDVPGPLKAVIGGGIGYRQEDECRLAEGVMVVRITPQTLADKLSMSGRVEVTSLGEGRCRRSFRFSVEARLFGVGGLLEKRLLQDLRDSWERGATFAQRWLREHPEG